MPEHLPDAEFLNALPAFTSQNPLKVLVSACLGGNLCGYDGSSYGEYPRIRELLALENIKPVYFCPENFAFGTPRELCNIHGGNGFDVLDGKARVLTESGKDWTRPMIAAAQKMLSVVVQHKIDLAILMDISAACGSQVIYEGHRQTGTVTYQAGAGVCAALLIRNGFKVMSQRDFKTLDLLFQKVEPLYTPDPEANDHHESDWYRAYFSNESS